MKPFSRCAGEGLIPTLAAKDGKEALLPFTGEGARRADEGARAERSVLLIFAWEGQQQLASLAPSSGAARHLLPLRRRRALSGRCGRDLTDEPLPPFTGEGPIPLLAASDGKEALLSISGEGARRADEGARAQRSVPLIFAWERQEQLAALAPSSGASRHLLPLRRRRAASGRCGRDLMEKPFSRLREKVPGGRMRGRERSEACF